MQHAPKRPKFFLLGSMGRGGGRGNALCSQKVPNDTSVWSHMLCPRLSSFQLYRWAKREGTLSSKYNSVLGSLRSFIFFGGRPIKMTHCKKWKVELGRQPQLMNKDENKYPIKGTNNRRTYITHHHSPSSFLFGFRVLLNWQHGWCKECRVGSLPPLQSSDPFLWHHSNGCCTPPI